MSIGNYVNATEYDPGDHWVTCDQGHTHWGRNGGAGMLLRHTDTNGVTRYFLQQRGPDVQNPGTWSTPGGAIEAGETPHAAAIRESQEELGQFPLTSLQHHHTLDHGGWAYHTMVGDVPHPFYPQNNGVHGYESADSGWFTPHEIDELPLHPGFREGWDQYKPNQKPNPSREIWGRAANQFVPQLWEQADASTEPQEVNNPEDHWPEWGERNPDLPSGTHTDYDWAYTRV